MSERKIRLIWTSRIIQPKEITISSIEDLEALCLKYDSVLVIGVDDSGKLSEVEVYDDYRE